MAAEHKIFYRLPSSYRLVLRTLSMLYGKWRRSKVNAVELFCAASGNRSEGSKLSDFYGIEHQHLR